MNIYKATSDICDTTLFSLKWNKHSFGLRLAKLREAAGISARQMSLDLPFSILMIIRINPSPILFHYCKS